MDITKVLLVIFAIVMFVGVILHLINFCNREKYIKKIRDDMKKAGEKKE